MNFDNERVSEVARKMGEWLDGKPPPRVALTLGSGLGGFGSDVAGAVERPYDELGLPACQAKGHAGILRYVPIEDLGGALVFDGRVHFYEGWELEDVVLAVRAAKVLGCNTQIITCASGTVDPDIEPGRVVVIKDHLNLMGGNPLRGANDNRTGPRFPDMTVAYDLDLRGLAVGCMTQLGMQAVHKIGGCVYAAMAGPNYETPAEVRMLRTLGADLAGMSTVPEVIALRHMGARVLALSCVTNYAAGVTDQPLDHEEVVAIGARTAPKFRELLHLIITSLLTL